MASSWRPRAGSHLGAYTNLPQLDEEALNHASPPAASDSHIARDHTSLSAPAVYIGSSPTPEDLLFLPRVSDALPWGAFLVAIVELCERFAYYGLSGPFQNYMANSAHDANGLPGALGLSQSRATALSNFFQAWCYVTPIAGAVVADQYLGRPSRSINVGSVSAIATTLLELHIGFWSAYLLPLIMFCVGYAVLVAGKDRYIIKPPQGGVIGRCFRALWIAARNGFDVDAARPSAPLNSTRRLPWDDAFISELKTALRACKVFLFFPIYWLTYSQMMNNFISQAGQMQLHSLPNDILPNIDPLTIILLVPLMDRLIYPFLRTRLHLAFTPATRITLGFLIASLAMLYASILQHFIYTSPPCFSLPSACPAALIPGTNGQFAPNRIHIAWQAPAYVLIALSEILASITGLEIAYAQAPASMKSFIMSLFLLTSAGGSALGILHSTVLAAKLPD
ncbi:peptide transporter ptr2 [Curvularia kusanoi]|uniref:Peptide transporter ptr2 n=1 Tax=Curvularia kusanoi TaxID=90978 RepID=A0A9P4T7X6_CURKU|nr:peptide transporter ptr2 [Curvularia kusanoi]